MKFDTTQRITGTVALIFAAYFVGHTVYKSSHPELPPEPDGKSASTSTLTEPRTENDQPLTRARRQRFTDNIETLEIPEKDILYEFVLDGFQMMPSTAKAVLSKYGHSSYTSEPLASIEHKTGFIRGTFHGHYEVNDEVKVFLAEWANTYTPSPHAPLSTKLPETGVPTKEPARHTHERAPTANAHLPKRAEDATTQPSGQTLDNRPQIQAAIRKVLSFPNAVQDSTAPPTMIETLLIDQTPRKLFNALVQYDDNAVAAVPTSGALLRDFLHKYYRFEQDTAQFEKELLGRIGGIVSVRFPQAWAIYLRYAIFRFSGMSKEQVIAGGDFLNYSITWEDNEKVYGQLSSDPLVAKRFSDIFSQYKGFVETTKQLRASGD